MNPKADFYFDKEERWQKEIAALRVILLDCGLTEEVKWGSPCYVHQGSNVVLIHTFKAYCAVLFFKGALLSDPHRVLVQQTQNVQAARQMRFTGMEEVNKKKAALRSYVYEAIEIEKAGMKVALKKTAEFDVPEEFQVRLDKNKSLKKAFASLTPGRQRAYLLHFSQAKQSKTREARIDKYIPQILGGKGLND
jgi:uncharacterized protein YdeI (YjbR/CyaY-like superfamily)